MSNAANGSLASPSRREAFALWLRIGLLSFGGPAGQIALMHRTIVDERGWLDEGRFLHALNYCMLLPGPEAQQLAVYVGWLLHGIRGSLVAGILFVAPGALVIFILSVLYTQYADLSVVNGIFIGVKAAVLAIVLHAVIRIGRRVLAKPMLLALAVAGFGAVFFLNLPFPFVVLGAAICGAVASHIAPSLITLKNDHEAPANSVQQKISPQSRNRTLLTALVFVALWIIPILFIHSALGPENIYTQQSLLFSKLAVVTFGGAYAVLAYMTQQVVDNFAWLSTDQMVDGLGLAETTPGPLILVTQFVAFVAAWNNPGTLSPLLAGTLAAALTLWVTFVPCFVWIYIGAPFIEQLRGSTTLNGALNAITAVVVGVIASLAIWFAGHVLFDERVRVVAGWFDFDLPRVTSFDWFSALIALAAAVALIRFRQPVLRVLLVAAVAGVAGQLAGLYAV